jgi:hypothetical protein
MGTNKFRKPVVMVSSDEGITDVFFRPVAGLVILPALAAQTFILF